MPDLNKPLALLGGVSPAAFMRRHWQHAPLLVRQAVPQLEPLLSRARLFALAARDDVESRLVVREGRHWRLRSGPLPRRALPPLAQPHWTLLVQGVDLHLDAAHRLLSRFRFVPDARLDDLMISYASEGGGVGPHLDSYDVFLLQLQGRRRWRIGRCAQPRWRSGVPLKMLARFDAEQTWTLNAGDMLYLPPGWAHEGVAVGGDCMTASIGFRAPSAGELAQALLARLADEPTGGDKRYRDARRPATAAPGAVPASLQAFARSAAASALAVPGAIERALGEWLTEPKPNVWFDAAPDKRVIEHAAVVLDRRTRMAYDARHIYINGESLRAAGRDARLVRQLADRRRCSARDVARLSTMARTQLDEWLAAGWIHADDAHDANDDVKGDGDDE